MTEPATYPLDILRTELKLAMSEQLVTLIDRFASKHDLAEFRADFAAHQREDEERFGSIDAKLDQLLDEKAERKGADQIAQRAESGRYMTFQNVQSVTTIVALIVAILAVCVAAHWIT